MNKSSYQMLRYAVECEVATALAGCSSSVDASAVCNSIMRHFLAALSAQEVSSQRAKRDLLTFRRNPDVIVPGWAFRKPGIDSRLPTL